MKKEYFRCVEEFNTVIKNNGGKIWPVGFIQGGEYFHL
jgi:hypothetical protein